MTSKNILPRTKIADFIDNLYDGDLHAKRVLSRLLHKSWHVIVTRTPTFRVANASQNSPCSIRPCHDCRPIASAAYLHRR